MQTTHIWKTIRRRLALVTVLLLFCLDVAVSQVAVALQQDENVSTRANPQASTRERQQRATATGAPSGTLVKFVILSRHGVRSPIPTKDELNSWTTRPLPAWPKWFCPPPDGRECDSGELTPQGYLLAFVMGLHYQAYLSQLLPTWCPAEDEVFFWADRDQRTRATASALLSGFRPLYPFLPCNPAKYLHVSRDKTDTIFHPVTGVLGAPCTLNVKEADAAIRARVPQGDLTKYTRENFASELVIAQDSLKCCQDTRCKTVSDECGAISGCSLAGLTTCIIPHRAKGLAADTQVLLGGGLRIASTFAEILLLEYANGFEGNDVGWGIAKDKMAQAFRLHAAAFDLEQRTPYIARLQGSRLLNKIVLALQGKNDNAAGTAPANAKFVAYIGHDTNIANVAGMLDLHWEQAGYQKDEMPPAGALTFELRDAGSGIRNVYVSYVAQSLEDMHALSKGAPVRTPVKVPGCSTDEAGFPCRLETFVNIATNALDPNRRCWQ